MNYCKDLEIEQKPNYDYLRGLFENILKNKGTCNDLHFSWIKDLSILNNYYMKNRITQLNLGKRKESPQSRIFRKLENSREINKEKESETDIKSLKTNNSLNNMQNIVLLKSQGPSSKYIIHKRFNSTGENLLLRSKDKDSENLKSGIAQYNISIEDEEQLNEKSFTNKKGDIKIIKELLSLNRDISNKKQDINKNNLYYFSGNVNDLCKSLVLKQLNKNKLNDFGIDINNVNNNEVKKQNSFVLHNRVFSSNSLIKMPNNNNDNITNVVSPNIIKSFSFIQKLKPKIEETKEIIQKEFYTNQKIQKSQ